MEILLDDYGQKKKTTVSADSSMIPINRSFDENVYQVPSTCTKVSRFHAVVHWHDGIATIEDRSTNGTFVNGQRVNKATITENDIVWLGGSNPSDDRNYLLDLRKVFSVIQEVWNAQKAETIREFMPVQETRPGQNVMPQDVRPAPRLTPIQDVNPEVLRTDYTKEFARVKQAYIDYHEKMSKLK